MKFALKWKVIGVCILLEILALAIITGISFQMISGYLDQIAKLKTEQLRTCVDSQYKAAASNFSRGSALKIIYACKTDENDLYYVLYNQDEQIVEMRGWPGDQLIADSTMLRVIQTAASLPWKSPSFYTPYYIKNSLYTHVLFGGTSTYKSYALHDLFVKGLLLLIVSVLLSVALLLLLIGWFGRHMKKLETAANQILHGDYDVSIDYVGNDEIGRVGFAINLVTNTLKSEIQALRNSEESERQTAERILKVIEAVPDLMVLCRVADGNVIYANRGAENMTGYAYSDLVGKSLDSIDLGITKEQRADWYRHLVKNGALTNYETIIHHRQGGMINVLISASLLEVDNAEHFLIICRDITDRKLVEAAVAHANRQLNYVLDAASEIAIISTDVTGNVQMFNRGAEKMLGYRAREHIGLPMPWEIHDKDELTARAIELSNHYGREVKQQEVLTITPAKLGAETRNWTYIRKNGQRITVSLTVTRVLDSSGKIVGFLGIARDITLQLQAEQALQELNYQLEKRVEERTAELAESNKNLESTMHNLQLAQAELVRSEKLNALGDIVAVVAHEINTPIGNCLTVATTLKDKGEAIFIEVEQGTIRKSSLSKFIEDTKSGMDILIRGLQRSSELVTNFKQVAVDQTSEQRRSFKLDVVINEVVALMLPMLRKTPYRLEISIEEDLVMDSFPGPIEQIVTNLINNSILHAFGEEQQGTMRLTSVRLDQQIEITFSDDGRGIPEHHLNRIFDPFFTTKLGRGGTGLGLNIVHNIVKKMLGGQIEVSSEIGKGTTFTLILPLVAPDTSSDRR